MLVRIVDNLRRESRPIHLLDDQTLGHSISLSVFGTLAVQALSRWRLFLLGISNSVLDAVIIVLRVSFVVNDSDTHCYGVRYCTKGCFAWPFASQLFAASP